MTVEKGIDPARIGLSKSLMTVPCSRQGFYRETVRDASGRRLSFPMPERVVFGSAVDAFTAYIVTACRDGDAWSERGALDVALMTAESKDPASWALIEDKDTFVVQQTNALSLYLTQPDGFARMRSRIVPSLRVQGDDGRTLRYEDIIGTPDFYDDQGVIDVKAAGTANGYGRDYTPDKFYNKEEMPVYALLWAAEHDGLIPPLMAYHVYVRQAKPHWQWIEVSGSSALITLGRLHAKRWRKGLEVGDPDLFDHDLSYCGECAYREAIPEAGHPGCEVGQARMEAVA